MPHEPDEITALRDEVDELRKECERRHDSAHRILDDVVATVRSLTRQGADAAVIVARVEQLTADHARILNREPTLDVIRDRMSRDAHRPPGSGPHSGPGWHDNAERGFLAWLQAKPYQATLAFLAVLFALLMLTDGGRDLIGAFGQWLAGPVDAAERAVNPNA